MLMNRKVYICVEMGLKSAPVTLQRPQVFIRMHPMMPPIMADGITMRPRGLITARRIAASRNMIPHQATAFMTVIAQLSPFPENVLILSEIVEIEVPRTGERLPLLFRFYQAISRKPMAALAYAHSFFRILHKAVSVFSRFLVLLFVRLQ